METDAPKIMRSDKPLEVFVTVLEENFEDGNLRPFGLSQGDFVVPDDFDAPLVI